MNIGDLLLLASGCLLYLCLTFILWRRYIHYRFPIFFSYGCYGTLASALRFLVSSNYRHYFYVYWWTELGFLLLGIWALHEAFRAVLEGFYLLKWFRRLYFGAIAALLAASILNSIFNRPIGTHPVMAAIFDLAIAINFIQAAIFGLFYVSVKLLNVSFRRYPFAIVLGFGISAIGTLIPFVLRSILGKKLELFAVYAPSVAYYIMFFVWLSAFWRREPKQDEQVPPLSPEQMADEVRQYTRVLKGFFGKPHAS